MSQGDAHRNSNSAWGHKIDVESQTIWESTQVVSEELVGPDCYETQQDGEVRLYLVAWKDGVWINTGLAPSHDKRLGLYATADGSWAIERQIDPEIEELPHAISRRVEHLTAVSDGKARRWSEIIEEAHHE